jgi:hypothetical protein
MNRFRITIKLAMAVVLFAGAGLATLRDPSMWRVGGVVACLIGLWLTACVGALYRTGRKRGSRWGSSSSAAPEALYRGGSSGSMVSQGREAARSYFWRSRS